MVNARIQKNLNSFEVCIILPWSPITCHCNSIWITFAHSWLAQTNPADVARVESRTFISTNESRDTIPTPKPGVKGTLGNWMSPEDMDNAIKLRFPGCMKGEYSHNSHMKLYEGECW